MADIMAFLKKALNGTAPQHKIEGQNAFELSEGSDGSLHTKVTGDTTVIYGKSTDNKPTGNIDVGKVFFEIDTTNLYIWDGNSWVEVDGVSIGSQGNSAVDVNLINSLPPGSNLIGKIKLTDGTNAVAVNNNGSLNYVPYDGSGNELFSGSNPGNVSNAQLEAKVDALNAKIDEIQNGTQPATTQLTGSNVELIIDREDTDLINNSYRYYGLNDAGGFGSIKPLLTDKFKSKAFYFENHYDAEVTFIVREMVSDLTNSGNYTMVDSQLINKKISSGASAKFSPQEYKELNDPQIALFVVLLGNANSGHSRIVVVGGAN